MHIVRLRAQIIYWALALDREREQSEDERIVMNSSNSKLNERNTDEKIVREGISPHT